MSIPNYLKPGIKVAFVLSTAVAFFAGYNTFLVDYSLEDLKFALNSVEKKELGGLDKLLSFTMVAEAAEVEIVSDQFANIEYAGEALSSPKPGRPVDDIKDILGSVIAKKKEARAGILNVLDTLSGRLARALGISSRLNDRLLKNERKAGSFLIGKKVLESRLGLAKTAESKQDLLYRAGIIEMKALKYLKGIDSFKEAVILEPDTPIGIKSLFNVAWCEKAAGRLEDSAADFGDFLKRHPKDELAKDAEYQMTILMRKSGKYKEAAEALEALADKYENSLLAPTVLFQAAGTYLTDLGDKEAAERVLRKLRERYFLSEFASSGTSIFKRLHPEEAAAKKGSVFDQLLWEASPLGKAVRDAIDISATRFVIKMIQGTIKYIDLWEWNIGDTVKVEKTDKFFTEWCEKYLHVVTKNTLVKVRNVTLRFREGGRIEIRGTAAIGGAAQEAYISGKMELKTYELGTITQKTSAKEAASPNWIVYTVDECRLGPMRVPPPLVNSALARAHKIFNQKIPFEIRNFHIAEGTGYWEGPQRASRAQLANERPEMYEYLYKSR